jgi:hypothetical protein
MNRRAKREQHCDADLLIPKADKCRRIREAVIEAALVADLRVRIRAGHDNRTEQNDRNGGGDES